MKKLLIWCTLTFFVATMTISNIVAADQGDEGAAAGQAANAVIKGNIDASHASANVPGYTSKPPELALHGQTTLTSQAKARLAYCATAQGDPVCEAQNGAMVSANMPRPNLTGTDQGVAAASNVTHDPASVLGNLSAYYAGCKSAAGVPGPCPSNVFCLGSSCFNTAYTADADFARTMSMMEAAREAGVYLDPNSLQVFKGEANSCRDRLLKNCCHANAAGAGMANQKLFGVGSRLVFDILMNADNRQFIYQGVSALLTSGGFAGSFKTFGVTFAINGTALPAGSVTLASGDAFAIAFNPWSLAITVVMYEVMSEISCNDNENRLALQEGAGLCHSVGSYCSSCIRILGHCVSCIEHSTGKCCFNSLLSRIVNEQGRIQAGKGWGNATSPDCSGFSIPQLQALDFAAMDLSEFYASIVPTLPDLNSIQSNNAVRVSNCQYGQGRCP